MALRHLLSVGVKCSTELNNNTSRVQELALPGLNLRGALSPSLGNLTSLETLNLSNNSLHGSIPDDLASLQNLTFLDLSSNNFSGTIPAALGDANLSLVHFNVSNNSSFQISDYHIRIVKMDAN
ncbi:hypothetical protein O6H91_10G044600 [Diphasiastrum complanatum]|uniref:Uncharacterized protein n=1 Tax=Diphasiastrum complanatum TaxID=34168 RepID=A0ACC2CGP4_DIPCM|nr:hypothetical protein O6H91_10G044600 [Diphasiastrum complanatum]